MIIDSSILWIIGQGITLSIAGVGAYIKLSQRVDDRHTDLVQRITKIETSNEILIMRGLHSPTDHFGADRLIDKYIKESYDLSKDDWIEFKVLFEHIHNDPSKSPLERIEAKLAIALADHKLMRYPRRQAIPQL